MKKLLVALSISALHLTASAVGSSSGPVTLLLVNSANVLHFAAGTPATPAACSPGGQWSVALDTAQGKMIYALLLSASAQGQSVSVVGLGTCGDWPNREKPSYVQINY